jgi:hypothetical protein
VVRVARLASRGKKRGSAGRRSATLTVTNTSGVSVSAFRVVVEGLGRGVKLRNASGTEGGSPFIAVGGLGPNGSTQLTLLFQNPRKSAPNFSTRVVG